ncbi:hypothetical protein CVM50_20590 [Pseudooceanicola marinus]|nr:hypothetical protein CVM50_20590 [Pseudooceanicola marinus]
MSLDLMGIKVPICGMDTESLLRELEDFAALHGVAPATVTSRAVGNSRLPARLRAGGSCTVRVAQKLRQYIKMNTTRAEQQDAA